MPLLRKQVTFVAAFLAVMFAQAYGLERGYASHHGISVIERDFEVQTGAVSSDQLMTPKSDRSSGPENHAPITVDMEAGRSDAAAEASLEFSMIPVAEIPLHDWILLHKAVEAEADERACSGTRWDIPPPAAVEVARCMVMLI